LKRRPARLAVFAIAVLASMPHDTLAQSHSSRFYVTVNGGAQAGGDALTDRREFELDVETATVEARHPLKAGALFDGGGGVRLWKRLGLGLSVSHFSTKAIAAVEARIPHPFQFDAHREISGDTARARRSETAVHVQLLYQLPQRGKLRAILFAGPSYLTAKQDLVAEVRYDQAYPYDSATFTSAELTPASGAALGFNAGVDAFWMFTNRFGGGALMRVTRASVRLDAPANRRIGIDAGGVHVGLGGRLIF
jgi:hypothetical protein